MRLAIIASLLISLACSGGGESKSPPVAAADQPTSTPQSKTTPFDGDRAFAHVKAQVDFGPRPAGSAAIERTREYISNELKSYGNLVLVRHSNGYVTAYAHASEVLVKRGDAIKRGQIIAKSGQSGEVGSPQLHFEIRRFGKPVDPLTLLPQQQG